MRFGDGSGNNVDLNGGNPAGGCKEMLTVRMSLVHSQRRRPSNRVSSSLGFANVHCNALLLQSIVPVNPSDPPAPREEPGWLIDSQEEWFAAAFDPGQFLLSDGFAVPLQNNATLKAISSRLLKNNGLQP